MRTFAIAAVLLMLAGCAEAPETASDAAETTTAATRTADEVIAHHEAMIKAGDLEGVMADYADDALLIAPHGVAPGETEVVGNDVFAGKENIRKFFAVLTDPDHLAGGRAMETRYEPRGHDVILGHWAQFRGTPQELVGSDTWVIRDGKVQVQVVTVAPPAK